MKKTDNKKTKREDEQKLEEEKARLALVFASESKEYIAEPMTEDGDYFRFISPEGLRHMIDLGVNINSIQSFLFTLLCENKLMHWLSQKEFELTVHIIGHVRDFYLEREITPEDLCLVLNFYLNVFLTNIDRPTRQMLVERAGKSFEDLYGASPTDFVPIATRIKQNEFADLLNYSDSFKECPFAPADKPLGIFSLNSMDRMTNFYLNFLEKYTMKFDVATKIQFEEDFAALLLSFESLFSYYLSYEQDQEIVTETKIVERPMTPAHYSGPEGSRFPLQSILNYQNKKDSAPNLKVQVSTDNKELPVTVPGPENEWSDLTEEEINGIKLKLEAARESLQSEYEAKLAALNTKKPRK